MATFRIDCDEDGFTLTASTSGSDLIHFRIDDPEALYDHVKGQIGPWLRERDEARASTPTPEARAIEESYARDDAYAMSDPEHPDFHSVHADIWDNRDKTERRGYQDMRRDLGRAPTAQEWQDERR